MEYDNGKGFFQARKGVKESSQPRFPDGEEAGHG
jgi:hypothetical protein